MGIYIKGMEMPKGNYYIDIRLFSDGWAHIPTDEPPYYNRAFEAIELPPHGRLGDLDELVKKSYEIKTCVGRYSRVVHIEDVKNAETILPADKEGGAGNG